MAPELHDLSIAELSGLIAARKLSPVELTEALIQRVERYDTQTRAFITPTFDLARRQARGAEAEIAAGKNRGPLHGIPFALKDIYDTKGILTSGHSRVFIDRIPAEDATTARRLYEAGAVLLGKLATHEMAPARPQPLEPRALHGRLLVGLGRRRRGGHGSGRARLGHGRLDPRPGIALRHRRAHADLRAGEPRRRHHQLVHVRSLRAARSYRRGLRAGAGGAGRL